MTAFFTTTPGDSDIVVCGRHLETNGSGLHVVHLQYKLNFIGRRKSVRVGHFFHGLHFLLPAISEKVCILVLTYIGNKSDYGYISLSNALFYLFHYFHIVFFKHCFKLCFFFITRSISLVKKIA